jgi:hypothetical protein
VAPNAGVAWAVDVDGAVVEAGLAPPNRPGVAPVAGVAAEEAGVAELPPPRDGNSDVVGVSLVVAPLVAVLAAPLGVAVLAGVAGGLPKPKAGLSPAEALGVDPALPNRPPEAGAAEDVAGLSADGWEAAGVPRLKAGVLLAGVVLFRPPNKPEGLGVSGVLAAGALLPPPKRPLGAGDAGVVLLASAEAPALPPPNRVDAGAVLPRGFAGAPNGLDVPVVGVAAALAPPKRVEPAEAPELGWLLPPNKPVPDDAWGFWALKRLLPGGGPAGVVDGREKVLFVAGVAAGVEPIWHRQMRTKRVQTLDTYQSRIQMMVCCL